jgi:hypothetical protein
MLDLPAFLQMCQMADRWGAAFCMGYCLERVNRVLEKAQSCSYLSKFLPQLPDSVQLLPQHNGLMDRCMRALHSSQPGDPLMPILLYLFSDVHALVASEERLKRFRQLPYSAIKAWAGSDDLVVDSENSVVVALDAWWQANASPWRSRWTDNEREHAYELSSLIRVQRLTTGG